MLLFRYFPTNCASLLIWPCSSYKKFTDDVHTTTSPPPSLLVFIFSFCYSTFIHSSLFLYFPSFFILTTVSSNLVWADIVEGQLFSFSHTLNQIPRYILQCDSFTENFITYKTPSMLLHSPTTTTTTRQADTTSLTITTFGVPAAIINLTMTIPRLFWPPIRFRITELAHCSLATGIALHHTTRNVANLTITYTKESRRVRV